MTLFYILKVNTSQIISNNLYIKTDFKTCKNNGDIISLGDTQVFRFIRRIKGEEFDKEYVENLYRQRNLLKQQDKVNVKEIIKIQNEINERLYVPDLVTVKTNTTKKDYLSICKTGFTVEMSINDKVYTVKYKRLCAGAGQLRRNSALFVDETKYDMLQQIMLCGLTPQSIGKINLAKFGVYFSLYTSATNEVTMPRICVVNDYEYVLKDQDVDWIYDNDEGERDIERRKMDFTMNAFDGAGIICPRMAERWAKDLGLDYIPESFIIRGPFLKGLVSSFDFHKFAHEVAHKNTITDLWGKEWDIDNIDAILTKSQFKLAKKYSSFESYLYQFHKYGHVIGVTRVNRKENQKFSALNYQYIQSNNFTEKSVKNLARPTTDWFLKILNGDPLYTSLLMIGYHDDLTTEQVEAGLDSNIAKCLLYNHDLLKDEYVKRKIYDIIAKKVNQAKIGKVYVEGSYDFLIPDLYAMCEHAFGMEVHGLLPAKCMYSRRWVEKGAKVISTQRSPLVAPAENQVMNVYCDDKCKEWFKYINWGNIYSIWDLTIISQSDK